MFQEQIQIIRDTFSSDAPGDSLHIDMRKISGEFPYCGLWFARDRSEESAITAEFYYSAGSARPAETGDELKENIFQQAVRFRIPGGHNHVWISARTASARCGMKLGEFRREKAYLSFRILRNRAGGHEVLKSGVIQGGQAWFAPLCIEDKLGEPDYKDTLYYLVLIKDPPPEDWEADAHLGVEGVPVLVPSCNFSADGTYAAWNGRNPLDEM